MLLPLVLAMPLAAAAAQEPAAAPAAPQAQTLAPYRINPGDEVQVFVWGEERLQRTAKILPDGSFSFPLVGRIEALGKLTTEIEATISRPCRASIAAMFHRLPCRSSATTGLQFSIIGKVRSRAPSTPAAM